MEKKMMIAGLAMVVGVSMITAAFAETPAQPQSATQDAPMKIMENPIERPLKAEPKVNDETKVGKEKAREAADVMTEHEKERMELRQTKATPKTENKIAPQDQQ